MPHPFVKWAGGKTQLLGKIIELMPKEYNTYYEVFLGGGALFFEITPSTAVINDLNGELICAYNSLKDPESYSKLIDKLAEHEKNHSEEYYYQIRTMDREEGFDRLPQYERAARMIYLNKSCFNGLYRVNSKGYFNVPFGKKEKVTTHNAINLEKIHDYLNENDITIFNEDFENAVKTAKKGDFVYFDPPYDTWNETTFTSYSKYEFGKEQQKQLAEVFNELSERDVYAMVSNHNTPFINNLYQNYNIHVVNAKRMINSDASGRGNVEEVIITNY